MCVHIYICIYTYIQHAFACCISFAIPTVEWASCSSLKIANATQSAVIGILNTN